MLGGAGFDGYVETLCASHYRKGCRPDIPPGVYFRRVFVGCFEGIDSQRGIARRCAERLGLRSFLGIPLTETPPVQASMSVIRQRVPETVFDAVFRFLLGLLETHRLLHGKTLGGVFKHPSFLLPSGSAKSLWMVRSIERRAGIAPS